jgi:hypothetical protein
MQNQNKPPSKTTIKKIQEEEAKGEILYFIFIFIGIICLDLYLMFVILNLYTPAFILAFLSLLFLQIGGVSYLIIHKKTLSLYYRNELSPFEWMFIILFILVNIDLILATLSLTKVIQP